VTDINILAQLPASARTLVKQVDLSSLGIKSTDVGKLSPHVYPGGNAQIDFYKFTATAAELFWDGTPLHRARYPNGPDQMMIPQNSMIISKTHARTANPNTSHTTSSPPLGEYTQVNTTLNNDMADRISTSKNSCGTDLNVTSCAETLAAKCDGIPGCLSFALTYDNHKLFTEMYTSSNEHTSYNKGWTYWFKPAVPTPPTPAPLPTPPSPAPTPAPKGEEVLSIRISEVVSFADSIRNPDMLAARADTTIADAAADGAADTVTAIDTAKDTATETNISSKLQAWAQQLGLGRTLYTHGEWSNSGWADTHKPLVAVSAKDATITVVKNGKQ
jgi:hypothetical protein